MKCKVIQSLSHELLEADINAFLEKESGFLFDIKNIIYSTCPQGAYVNYSVLIMYV